MELIFLCRNRIQEYNVQIWDSHLMVFCFSDTKDILADSDTKYILAEKEENLRGNYYKEIRKLRILSTIQKYRLYI